MIEFNFPFDTKWQEEDKIITFQSFRNRLRLYPLYFKLGIESIQLNHGDQLENINLDESDTKLTITFKNEVNKNISILFYQFADVFRLAKNNTTSHSFRGKSFIYDYSDNKPGLFKFEVSSAGVETIADGIIKNVFLYYYQKEMTMGQRDFNPLELSKYPVCVVPYRYGELIKEMIPCSSIVTCNKSIMYQILLKEPSDSVSASVKCGDVKAKVSLYSDYNNNDKYYMDIKFSEIGFYNCIIWVNSRAQVFFNILYTNNL
jgi:hypothetical protein